MIFHQQINAKISTVKEHRKLNFLIKRFYLFHRIFVQSLNGFLKNGTLLNIVLNFALFEFEMAPPERGQDQVTTGCVTSDYLFPSRRTTKHG